jgi:hypothetical protein
LLLFTIPVWPAIAGCTSSPTHYIDGNTGTVWIYSGVTSIPNLPADANKVTMGAFNFMANVKARNSGELVSVAQVAAECNIPPSQIRGIIPPDCNDFPITNLGDPNKMFYYRLALDVNSPAPAIYTGQVRIMGTNTQEIDVVIVVNSKQIQFFIRSCK